MINKIKHLVAFIKLTKELVEVYDIGLSYKRAWETIYGYEKYGIKKYYDDVLPYLEQEKAIREQICYHLEAGKLVSRKYRLKAKNTLTETRNDVNFILKQKDLMEKGLL